MKKYRLQKGAVLIVGLIILLMLGILSTSSLNAVILEQKVSNSLYRSGKTSQRAEAALAYCEQYLDRLDADSVQIGDVIHHTSDARDEFAEQWFRDEAFWLRYGMEVDDLLFDQQASSDELVENLRCFIEVVSDEGAVDVMVDSSRTSASAARVFHFRITSRAGGFQSSRHGNGAAAVVLQSDVFKRMY